MNVDLAHGLVRPGTAWNAWSIDPGLLALVAGVSVLYWRGAVKMRAQGGTRFASTRRTASFFAGVGVLAVALMSPLDALGETLFSLHMLQHLLLIVVAPPLIVYGAPFRVGMLALPLRLRRPIHTFQAGRPMRALKRTVAGPIVAWTLHVGVLWAWHLPSLYQSAVTNRAVHVLEHGSFIVTSLLFWSLLIQNGARRKPSYAGGLVFVFATTMQSAALGMVLLFAPAPLYPVYGAGAHLWGLTPLEDQQIAGASMWVPMGIVYFGTMAVLFLRWFKEIETRMRRKEGTLWSAAAERSP